MRYLRLFAIGIFVISLGAHVGTTLYQNHTIDKKGPVIESQADVLRLSVKDGENRLTDWLTATDEKDGDLTDKILVSGKSLFTEKGIANIKYVVFDSDQNFTQYTRPVQYTDYHSPEFALTQPLVFSRGTTVNYLANVTAYDQLDGDLTEQIKTVSSQITTSELGVYPVKLEVTNSYGDTASVEVNLLIRERNNAAAIELNNYLLYLDREAEFDPGKQVKYVTTAMGEPCTVEYDETEEVLEAYDSDGHYFCDVHVNGTVDTEEPGTYQLTYTYETDGTEAITYQTVVVRE